MPWRSALWLYNTSWLDQNSTKQFLKQLARNYVVLETIPYGYYPISKIKFP